MNGRFKHGFGALICLGFFAVDASPAEPTAAGLAFFEKKIRPVLVERCYKCHSAKSEKLKGGLLLDTRAGIRKGGDSGHAVVPGNVRGSLLIVAIRYGDEDFAMPPKEKLPAGVIADFEKWIAMGAPDPREGVALENPGWEKSKNHWAFKVPTQPTVPKVKDANWARSDIDRFVLAKLEAKSMKPSGAADRRTLIRRLFFDLNGVPPTPKEVAAFVADKDPRAVEKLVDRLLASESFGERWGRHWLDVARFAESSSKEANNTYPHAWRYRDYVIAAFNADKPYNQFIREQIAGDLLPARDDQHRAEMQTATGFLAIGPKSHNERNPMQFFMDVLDEQIEATSRAVLGLTIACARCHDHKFDPIPQREYYALAGIFASSEVQFGTIRGPGSRHVSSLITLPVETAPQTASPLTAANRARLERSKEQAIIARNDLAVRIREDRAAGRNSIPPFRLVVAGLRINTVQRELDNYFENGTAKPLAMGVRDRASARGTRLLERGEINQPGDPVPRGFVSIVNPDFPATFDRSSSGRRQLAGWLVDARNPLTARVMANRVWHHLLGQGLVRSMDNFGSTGEAPSHPALLDHLALRFVENKWSVKKLIREIVLTQTYRQSSRYNSAHYNADPENRFLWRASKRRLDAESIRDAMLSVSGLLIWEPPRGSSVARAGDGQVGGPGGARSRLMSDVQRTTDHRSVFLPIVRDLVPESLALFDFAEPSLVTGKRDTTTVPSQALYLMNNPFVTRAADAMARRLFQETDTNANDTTRVRLAFQLAYGRAPTNSELEKSGQFFKRYTAEIDDKTPRAQSQRASAWSSFCQALLCSAEFRYVN